MVTVSIVDYKVICASLGKDSSSLVYHSKVLCF